VGVFVFLYSVTVELSPVISLVVLAVGILWCCVYLSTAAGSLKTVSDYGSFGFGDFIHNLKEAWPAGLVMGFFIFAAVIMITVGIPFYLGIGKMTGLFLAALLFWLVVGGLLSFQFFFAIRARLDTRLTRVIKKCVLIFLDNPGFAFFSIIHNIVILAISFIMVMLFPGPAGILLYLDEALRLRLLKYDWLEANPAPEEKKRRVIPWDVILIDERERTGNRSFKNFIFPWKD
jgi:hypothetical protein